MGSPTDRSWLSVMTTAMLRPVQTIHRYRAQIRTLLLCAVLFSALQSVCASAETSRPFFVGAGPSQADGALPTDAVSIFQKKDGYYLFLPSAWDPEHLVLC